MQREPGSQAILIEALPTFIENMSSDRIASELIPFIIYAQTELPLNLFHLSFTDLGDGGLLNSKIYRFLYNFMSGDKQTFQRIILENIKSLPMPKVSELLDSNIGYMAKTILYDTNIDSNMLEKEIDQIVYKLYGLTDAEIKIIEQSI